MKWQPPALLTAPLEPSAPVSTLSKAEKTTLDRCEETVGKGLRTFIDVGHALQTIRDQGLHRDSYPTFEAYCQGRWEITPSYASRLIDGAKVIDDLLPIGNDLPLPSNEAQARPLAQVAPEKRPEAWKEVIKQVGSGRVTAKVVTAVANKYAPPKPVVAPPANESKIISQPTPDAAHQNATTAPAAPAPVVAPFAPAKPSIEIIDHYAAYEAADRVVTFMRSKEAMKLTPKQKEDWKIIVEQIVRVAKVAGVSISGD